MKFPEFRSIFEICVCTKKINALKKYIYHSLIKNIFDVLSGNE